MIETKTLRKKALELAFSGQLSSVDRGKGDSRALIKCIVQKKEQMVKDKVISKIKTLSAIRDDEKLFSIPDNWEYVKLGLLSLPLSDGVHYAPEYQTVGYKCFSAKDIYNSRINDSNCTFITKEEYLGMKDKINVQKGSILITKSGSIGRSVVVKEYFEFGLVESIGVINPIIVNPEYIKFVLDYGFVFTSYYFDKYTRGVGLKHLTLTLLENIPIPVPPLEEQESIVNLLNSIFSILDTIDNLQAKYSNDLAVLKSKIIDTGIQGKLTEQLPEDGDAEELYAQILDQKSQLIKEGKIKKEKPLPDIAADEIPFEIPKNWKWVRIGQIFTLQAGKNKVSVGIHNQPDDRYKYPCYGGNGLRGYVDESNVLGKHILIGRQGALCGNINIADNDFWATEHAVVVYQYGNTVVDCYKYFFRALNLNQYATSVAQPGLSVANIEKVLIPLPPLAEQKRIAIRIQDILNQLSE